VFEQQLLLLLRGGGGGGRGRLHSSTSVALGLLNAIAQSKTLHIIDLRVAGHRSPNIESPDPLLCSNLQA